MRNSTKLEDVQELMQQIQSRLPVKESARTSVLSKSWLRAWSTIPSLRFHVRETKHLNVVDRTVNKYLLDNIPIERFDLDIRIENQESASLAEKWIRSVATKTCLKELSLSTLLDDASLTLPDEILLIAKNLTKLEVKSKSWVHSVWMTSIHHPPIISCVSLRQVHLKDVRISQEVLDAILSSCSLLEKIELTFYYETDLKSIKVINLPCLYELTIDLEYENFIALEIIHVPNLRLFTCHLEALRDSRPPNVCTLSLGRSITELNLAGLITDDAFLNMIKSEFPFLESLTLDMECWTLGCFHFTCASLKRLTLMWFPKDMLIDIQVYAPKLEFFSFRGYTMPNLLFPVSSLNQIMFTLELKMPVDTSFFLKMREALTLSCYCDVDIITLNYKPALDIDINDLRTRLPYPPAKNVQRLSFYSFEDECMWEHSPFFDAFFEICHPKRVYANPDMTLRQNNHFCKLMLREVLEEKKTTRRGEYWPRYLKHVQIWRHPYWETLTNSHTRFLDGQTPFNVDFKLIWC